MVGLNSCGPTCRCALADPMRINDLYVFSYNWLMADYLDSGKEVGGYATNSSHPGRPRFIITTTTDLTVGPWDLMEWDALHHNT